MNEAEFEMKLPLAIPARVKALLENDQGRKYLINKLSEATFRVQEKPKCLTAVKLGPSRSYGFQFDWLENNYLLFSMEVDSATISNPHKFFLEILASELHMIVNFAKEFLAEKATNPETKSSAKARIYT